MRGLTTWQLGMALGVISVTGVGLSACASEHELATHERYSQGDCASCHEEAPLYHRESNWQLTHGRAEEPLAARCATCHEPDACTECHRREPATHTAAFKQPSSDTLDSERHALLGSVRPSSCMACHQEVAADCTGCHVLGEVDEWRERGAPELERWQQLLGIEGSRL